MIVFDLSNSRAIKQNSTRSKSAGEGILRKKGLSFLARFSDTPADNVFSGTSVWHTMRVPLQNWNSVLK